MSFQASKSNRSGHSGQDVFLSHSGTQKNFVRQLYTDLTNQGLSCFFDENPESLPLAENFPSLIFEAAKTCEIAVLLLSKEFLESKWPMQELAAFVEARDTTPQNPKPRILPLFFLISPHALRIENVDKEKWKRLDIPEETQAKWLEALKAIRSINGINFRDGDDEVEFRGKVVKEIWRILPPSQRYHIPHMQGGERMCQDVTNFFNTVLPNEKGFRIAGLYGIAGHGKTSLCKAFCNLLLTEFEGRVCNLEFSRDDSFERVKLALRHLTHCPQSRLQTFTKDQAEVELYKRLKGQKVLLVLDNITEQSIDEVRYYMRADLSENSYMLLSSRSVDVLVKHFKIDPRSCMHVPSLEEDEAIDILLEGTSLEVSMLRTEERHCALKCANRCLFRFDAVRRCQSFHPLALKAFGSHLFSQYDEDLSKWVTIVDGLLIPPGYGLDALFAVLREAFNGMLPEYRTIFMLLTMYMLPDMSPHKVTEWLAIICNEDILFIKNAVEDLRKKAFIEEFEPEIRIHDLYIEFAQSTANKMRKWLWWKGDPNSTRQLISKDQDGFELAKLEQCMHRCPSQIPAHHLENLLLLQLVDVKNMGELNFSRMRSLRSVTLQNCEDLAPVEGMEKLVQLAWLQISEVNPMFKLPTLSCFPGLQHLEIHVAVSHVLNQLGDLTSCSHLREINVRCPTLSEFPRLNDLYFLEKVEFSACIEVKGPLDCTNCVMLQSLVLNGCCKMAAPPVIAGCKKVYKIVLSDCDAVMACPDINVAGNEPGALKILELSISPKAASVPRSVESCEGLENLHLWNMGELKQLPSFNRLSNLTVLKIGKCNIGEPPDLRCCVKLENVCFFTLKNLERFPNFSLLRELKILSLYNCRRVEDPPDISGLHELQVFHLVYNDNMKALPKMHECPQLDEIKVSWCCKDEVTYEGIDPDSCEVDDNFQSCLDNFKDEIPVEDFNFACVPIELREWLSMQEKRWMQGRTMLAKKYFRGVKLYCSVTSAYESSNLYISKNYIAPRLVGNKNYITLRLVDNKVIAFPTPGRVSKDRDWLDKVREYFARKNYIARASGAYYVLNSALNGEVSKDRGWLNKVQKCFAGKDCGWLNKMQVCFFGARAVSDLRLPRYHVPAMQGEERMCQKVAKLFIAVHPNEKGIRIAGLYGMPGVGKSTLGKAFCNRNLRDYDGKVFHVEFGGGNALETQKLALQHLTHSRNSQFEWVTGEDDVRYFFCAKVEGQRVLLVLDNIAEDSIDKARDYLEAHVGIGSRILLIARSKDILLENLNVNSESCMRIPGIEEEEALAILLETTSVKVSALEDRRLALKCANICLIGEGGDFAPTFHPLALKAFGRHCFNKHNLDLSKWVAEIDGPYGGPDVWSMDTEDEDEHVVRSKAFDVDDNVQSKAMKDNGDDNVRSKAFDVVFDVLGMAFADMDGKSRSIFMLLTLLMPPKLSSDEIIKGLAQNCMEEVEDLYKNGFIEQIAPEIHINHLMEEFAEKCSSRFSLPAQNFSSSYDKDGLSRHLKRNIDALDDDEKQYFLDVAAFPEGESIPANALLDIWVYVRGMTRDKAVVLLLKFAAHHLLHLRRDSRLPSIRDDFLNSYTLSQDDVQRNVALLLVELYNRTHFKRMYISIEHADFNGVWHEWAQEDKYRSSESEIVSFRTVSITHAVSWPQMYFPEAEALILYIVQYYEDKYCIPPFLFQMEKLKVLIIHNDRVGTIGLELTGLDNFQLLSQLQSLHLERLTVPSLLEHCKVFEGLEKIRFSRCQGLGRYTVFDFPGLLECYVESCRDLKELPTGICSSKSLKVLSITDCHSLRKLPDELDKLGSLKEIRLGGCSHLRPLPPSICNLTKLEILDISGYSVYGEEEQSVLMETLQKLSKIPSLRSLICEKRIKELFESSFRPGLLKFVVVKQRFRFN